MTDALPPLPAAAGRPILIEPAPHLPFLEPRIAHAPGLMPLRPEDWLRVDADFADQMAAREALIETRPGIVLALGEDAGGAAAELLDTVLAALPALPGFRVADGTVERPDGGRVTVERDAPFRTIGRLTAYDFCVLQPDAASGEYRLGGAVLCFPARWSLAEKMGRPLTAIHAPVPDYDDALARRVNRVFEAIRPERPLWRINWLVYGDPVLHQPFFRDGAETPGHGKTWQPEGPFYLRTERQTLRRLPRTGAVAFGIKSSVTPVEALAPSEAAGLSAALGGLDAGAVEYRIGTEANRAIRARLDALAAGAEAAE
ncbi:MAG: DUF3445 domain-containing protein [Pseudomonadota bacterium]